LSERFDAGVVREIYEGFGAAPSDVLATTDVVLQARGSSLPDEYLEFAAYNAATGDRARDGAGYQQAKSYPQVPITSLPSSEGVLTSDVGSGLGAFYYSLDALTPTELTLEADATRTAALLIPFSGGKLELLAAKALPATLAGEGLVVVAGQTLSSTDAPFTLRGTTSTPGGDAAGPASSGCSLGNPGSDASWGGAGAVFGAILLSRRGSRARRLKVP
jgi:hypothetical protein